jgi:hypothetical protein
MKRDQWRRPPFFGRLAGRKAGRVEYSRQQLTHEAPEMASVDLGIGVMAGI